MSSTFFYWFFKPVNSVKKVYWWVQQTELAYCLCPSADSLWGKASFSISPWPFPTCLKARDFTQSRGVETEVAEDNSHPVTLWKSSISCHNAVFIPITNTAINSGAHCDLETSTTLCLWICDNMLITPCSQKFATCLARQKASWTSATAAAKNSVWIHFLDHTEGTLSQTMKTISSITATGLITSNKTISCFYQWHDYAATLLRDEDRKYFFIVWWNK